MDVNVHSDDAKKGYNCMLHFGVVASLFFFETEFPTAVPNKTTSFLPTIHPAPTLPPTDKIA